MMHLPDFSNTEIAFRSRTQPELWRAITLFRMINVPLLVKAGSPLLTLGFRLHLPLSPLVRWTVFRQFCGGESLDECRKTIDRMAGDGVKSILDYGVEGEKTEYGFDAATAEILRTATEAGQSPHIPFVVFKMTALARMNLLERVSSSGIAGLTPQEAEEWQRVLNRVERICQESSARKRPVLIDAEESWIQPAIDQVSEDQMRARNRERAWIYTTVQMYRTDRLSYLKELIARSEREEWHVGVKLVRGAYMEKERHRAQQNNQPSPVHPDKSATDRAYDAALFHCLDVNNQLRKPVWLCIGTHNEASCLAAAKILLQKSSKSSHPEHVWFSQLLGMGDHLSYNLAESGFKVAKYVPYGPVHAVLPYLMRRAQENTSVAGQSSRELQLLEKEVARRSSD